MSTRLRKVEHIEVFDMEGEMVAGKKEDPFSYTYQKEYFYGEKKLGEKNYNSSSKKLLLEPNQLHSLQKRANKMLQKAYCFVEEDCNVDVVIRGGSTIKYTGSNKEGFMQKVLRMEMK